MLRVAINGCGRIGRVALRLLQDEKNVQVVAINNRTPGNEQLAYLYRFDSSHRTLKTKIGYDDEGLIIKGKKIKVFAEEDPSKLPWAKLRVDVVLECTGAFTSKEACQAHINAGAKHVIISAPAKDDAKTIVYGVNQIVESTKTALSDLDLNKLVEHIVHPKNARIKADIESIP